MKKILSIGLFFLVATAVFSVPLTASWVEGKVERNSGKAWALVNIGDKIDSSESIRLASGAMAEFTEGNRHISLSAAGTYALEALVKAGGEKAKNRSSAMGKLGKLVDQKAADSATAIAGVRGAEQGQTETMWMTEGEDANSLAEEAKSFAPRIALRRCRFPLRAGRRRFQRRGERRLYLFQSLVARRGRIHYRSHQGAPSLLSRSRRLVHSAQPPPRPSGHRFRLRRRGSGPPRHAHLIERYFRR